MATLQSCVQLAMEESPRYEGAPTTTPYRVSTTVKYAPIQSVQMGPGVQWASRADELRGIEGSVAQLVDGYEVGGSLSVRAYPNLLPFLFNVLGFTDTITPGDGVIVDPDAATIPATAFRHVFTKRGGVSAKTLQMLLAYVNEGVFLKAQGVGLSSLGGNADGNLTGDLMGLVMGNVADPNVTPAYESQAIPHFRRGDLSLTWLASSGTTDDFTWTIANPLNRRRTLGVSPASYFPDKMEHASDRVRISGTIPKSVLADADVDTLLAGSTFAAKAKWVSPKVIAATAYKYSMWFEMPSCQLTDGTFDPLTNARRFGGSYGWWAAWDETAGYDLKITLVCAVTSAQLETLV